MNQGEEGMTLREIAGAIGISTAFAVGCTIVGWLIVKGLIFIGAWL